MRILQIVHDFLPRHVAGVEVYTDQLTRHLARGHDVALLFSEVVPEAPNYSLRRGRRGKVLTYEVVNNQRLKGFDQTYRNPAIDRRVEEVLDEFEPDVVHIQHLINLSIDAVHAIRRRGIPILMTLHDHWLECANGGQRFHRDLGRCDELDPARCGSCTAHMSGAGLGARGILRRRAAASASAGLSLLQLTPAIETPVRSFVYHDAYYLDGVPRPTFVAHPPTSLRFELESEHGGRFVSALSMHPETFDASGGGVRFRVAVDGDTVIDEILDPKQRKQDRHPLRVEVELPQGRSSLELRTEADPPESTAYCTAGWIDPRVIPHRGSVEPARTSLLRPLQRFARFATRMPASVQTRRIERRWELMRRLPESIDFFISPSQYLRREFVDFGFPEDRVLYSDYGFEMDGFTKRADLPEVARHFAFIGSLVPHKGVHVLLEAFTSMPEDARLDVCGSHDYDPGYSEWLRSIADHPGIRFLGGIPPREIARLQQGIDCQIVPSIWQENSPLTIHEAFLSGIPVIASRMGGNVDLLSQGGGLLYHPDDAEHLHRQLMRLYSESGLARELAASAPAVKSMDEQVSELLPLYEDLHRKASALRARVR